MVNIVSRLPFDDDDGVDIAFSRTTERVLVADNSLIRIELGFADGLGRITAEIEGQGLRGNNPIVTAITLESARDGVVFSLTDVRIGADDVDVFGGDIRNSLFDGDDSFTGGAQSDSFSAFGGDDLISGAGGADDL
ncbi:MAG: hypothetical protein AAFU55_10390, partial [Pseudomonadota bacterium]